MAETPTPPRVPGVMSGLYGPMNVHHGTVICAIVTVYISSFVYYTLMLYMEVLHSNTSVTLHKK